MNRIAQEWLRTQLTNNHHASIQQLCTLSSRTGRSRFSQFSYTPWSAHRASGARVPLNSGYGGKKTRTLFEVRAKKHTLHFAFPIKQCPAYSILQYGHSPEGPKSPLHVGVAQLPNVQLLYWYFSKSYNRSCARLQLPRFTVVVMEPRMLFGNHTQHNALRKGQNDEPPNPSNDYDSSCSFHEKRELQDKTPNTPQIPSDTGQPAASIFQSTIHRSIPIFLPQLWYAKGLAETYQPYQAHLRSDSGFSSPHKCSREVITQNIQEMGH